MARTPSQDARRRFMRSIFIGGGMVGAGLAGAWPILRDHELRLRPPGAIPEKEFLASCIKCGQCVQVCPVKAIKLADITDGFGVGVPHIDARDQACDFSCDAVQCILACPTGALTHKISKKEEVHMGIAVLKHPEICLAKQGLGFKGPARPAPFPGLHRYEKIDRWKPIPLKDHPYDLELCDLCVRECPIKGAISLVDAPDGKGKIPKIHKECTGCGMCEMICPTEPAAIVIVPRKEWEA